MKLKNMLKIYMKLNKMQVVFDLPIKYTINVEVIYKKRTTKFEQLS